MQSIYIRLTKVSVFITSLLVFSISNMYAQTGTSELRGKVTDPATKEPIPFAAVIVEQNGVQVAGTKTDFDGNYSIKPLNPGNYDVRFSVIGYTQALKKGVLINSNKTTYLNQDLNASVTQTDVVEITAYKIPVFEKDQTSGGASLSSEQIRQLPTRSINAAVATSSGVYANNDGSLNVKGARGNSTIYFVDGVKVTGNPGIPQGSIEQLDVITSGIPAEFGDVTGGVISLTTKGISKNTFGGLEGVTSEFIGKDGYSLVAGNVSTPLLKKNKGESNERAVLGINLSGEYQFHRDPNLPSTPIYKVNDAKLAEIQQNPLAPSPANASLTRNAGELVTFADLERIKYRQDAESKVARASAKLTYQPSQNTTFTLGLTGIYNNNKNPDFQNSLFNVGNNPQALSYSYRSYFRYTQRFGNQDEQSASTFKNVFYQIQADYNQDFFQNGDLNLKDDLFKYGYMGKFKSTLNPVFDQTAKFTKPNGDSIKNVRSVVGLTYSDFSFTRDEINPLLANYGTQFFDYYGSVSNPGTYIQNGGLRNGDNPSDIYFDGLFNNSGSVNNYNKGGSEQARLTFKFNTDIKNHSIQVGGEYEQRNTYRYSTFARGLWTLMRFSVNNHLTFDDSIPWLYQNGKYVRPLSEDEINNLTAQDTLFFYFKSGQGETGFSKNFRAANQLDIGMFSPDELIANNGSQFIDYFGYDYTGKRIKGNVGFNDFFTDTINRPLGSFKPIYMAGYIQDKFQLNDLIMRIGLRVDRFDANTKVLQDKYSVYATRTAGEVKEINGATITHPSNIGEDFVVYVNDPINGGRITGYRDGDKFYDAAGNLVQNSDAIRNDFGKVTPYFSSSVQYDANGNPLVSSSSFVDYTPQINYMPRVSFSFPISEEAVFFANYDVLTQRPQLNFLSNALDYYQYSLLYQGITLTNPNIKAEKTIDYQLGYKQKVSSASAISLSAFYREVRDQIQQVNVRNAYPIDYTSFQNQDFGTVKGMTFDYDLRRTQNLQVKFTYTLQFADGTGSSATSAQNLLATGQSNILIPTNLAFDQRHTFVTSLDYRYDLGSRYDGPENMRWLLEGFGGNMLFRVGSGTPYSRQQQITRLFADNRFRNIDGTLNGSRLPWNFNADLRVDKFIEFSQKENNGGKSPANVNLYFQVQNVFNNLNIINVYAATGNPDDDGFLSTAGGQQIVNAALNPQSFYDLYTYRLNNPANYSLPRLIRIGAILSF
jgi:outer membrane receptor protein involved in Fe transport